jgi:ankyrin repeat protein
MLSSIFTLRNVYTQHVACQNWWRCTDFAATVAVLTSHGANMQLSADIITESAHYKWLPLHLVAANSGHAGSAAAVRVLVTEHSIAVDTLTSCMPGRTAAWLAAHYACTDSSSSSSTSGSSDDTTEYTLECLEQLLQLGADLHATGSRSLLCAAAASGNTRVAQLLFDRGLQYDDSHTAHIPLHCAARKDHTAMVQLLLSRGASVSTLDNSGCTALRACLEAPSDNAELFKVLIAAGGDPLDIVPDSDHESW